MPTANPLGAPLPPPTDDEEERDPRADLVARLLAYEKLRRAAEALAAAPRRNRDFVSPSVVIEIPPLRPTIPPLRLADIRAAAKRLGISSALRG